MSGAKSGGRLGRAGNIDPLAIAVTPIASARGIRLTLQVGAPELMTRVWRQDGASAVTAALCSCTTRRQATPACTPCVTARRANLRMVRACSSGKSKHALGSRLDEEGRFGRSSRYVGRGCDGRGWPSDERANADGEVVWSWHPDADAKLAMMLLHHAVMVARKPGAPGRARYKP